MNKAKIGSVDFSKKGGILGNCSPCHDSETQDNGYGYFVDKFQMIGDDVFMVADEPGPGCFCCCLLPICCPLLTWANLNCFFAPCDEALSLFPKYLCCGLCGPVNTNAVIFTLEKNAVKCEIYNKHCCTEEPTAGPQK